MVQSLSLGVKKELYLNIIVAGALCVIILEKKISIGRSADGKVQVFKNGQKATWLLTSDMQEELGNILKAKTIEILNKDL